MVDDLRPAFWAVPQMKGQSRATNQTQAQFQFQMNILELCKPNRQIVCFYNVISGNLMKSMSVITR